MPTTAKRPCNWPGCGELVEAGYCPAHRQDRRAGQRDYDRRRGSAALRGYDHRWRRWRRWFLTRHPLCVDCQAAGRTTLATEVHHVEPLRERPELRLAEANCVALCRACHSRRTARDE